MCVLVHVLIEFPNKIILPCFGYQLHSCIFCVGLTSPTIRMEAFCEPWIIAQQLVKL